MVKKILMTLDTTPFTPVAISHAISLGKAHKAEVTGLAIVDRRRLTNVGPMPVGGSFYARNLRNFRLTETNNRIDGLINTFKSTATAAGVDHHIERREGDPFHLVVLHASRFDLIITGLRNIFNYGVGPEPKNLLRRIASAGVAPILAVGREFSAIRRVFVVYNGPPDSSSVLTKLQQLNIWPDLSICVGYFGAEESDSQKLLVDAAAECSAHGLDVHCRIFKGTAKAQLFLHAAEWKSDLIVMSESSRRFLVKKAFNDSMMYAIQRSNIALFLT